MGSVPQYLFVAIRLEVLFAVVRLIFTYSTTIASVLFCVSQAVGPQPTSVSWSLLPFCVFSQRACGLSGNDTNLHIPLVFK